MRHWDRVRPEKGRAHALSPHVNPGWEIDINRDATFAEAQAQLPRMEAVSGFTKSANLHSFRNWAPTCANKLRFPREERERLGHWATGSTMPGRYDKAVCATDRRLGDEILKQIRPGWRPSDAYEVAPSVAGENSDVDSEKSETSTCSEVVRKLENIANLDSDVPRFEDYD